MSPSSKPKPMNMISTGVHHELVLVFMPYYYLFYVDFNGFMNKFKEVYWGNSNIISGHSN